MSISLPLVPGYQVLEELFASRVSVAYRARAESDDQHVILKITANRFPAPGVLARLRREFELGVELAELEGLIGYRDSFAYKQAWVLVLEDFGAASLVSLLDEPIDLSRFLTIAETLARALSELHIHGVIHRDLSPGNVFYNAKTGQLKIGDLGIATRIPRTAQAAAPTDRLEGNPGYMSPEQTGRMNRAVDYRTDLYSLGATLYHLLTGQPPFEGQDIMALVHAHIARDPRPPAELRDDTPEVLGAILLRLLSKAAEDRYQSASGVAADFAECARHLNENGGIASFPLGERDTSAAFGVSEKLYGRDNQLAILLNAFADASGGERRVLLVRGPGGIGKTLLVREVHKPIAAERGFFATGKFDRLGRTTPLAPLRDAVGELIRQVLAESETRLEARKQDLLAAVGSEGQVLIDFLPEIEHVLGSQPPVIELDGEVARERFDRILQAFLRVFAKAEHPLVLFFDDLQWVDPASLRFLTKLISNPKSRYLLVIGTYRDNEVTEAHPLRIALERMSAAGTAVTTITLDPLSRADLVELIGDTTGQIRQRVGPLAALIEQKTGGNPFFVTQFLRTLAEDDLLWFEPSDRAWAWDLDRIRELDVIETVVDLMVEKIGRYSEATQQLMQLASCLGSTFDLETLAVISACRPGRVASDLWPPIRDGLLLPLGAASEICRDPNRITEEPTDPSAIRHKFGHDRIQEAALAQIPDETLGRVNLEIGRLMLDHLPDEQLENRVFDVVHHLNLGAALIDSPDERERLVRLNLEGGLRAKSASAFDAALGYFTQGIELLDESAWDSQYDLMFQLQRQRLECEYLCGSTVSAEALFRALLKKARSRRQRSDLYRLMMRNNLTENKYAESLEHGRECLGLFRIELPREAERAAAVISNDEAKIVALLSRRSIASLSDDPAVDDPDIEMCMGVLAEHWSNGLMAPDFTQVALAAIKLVLLSLEHGHCKYSALGYVAYSAILVTRDDYTGARAFGNMGMRLSRRYDDVFVTPMINNTYANFTHHFIQHIRENIPVYEESYRACLQCGDRWWGSWAVGWIRYARLVKGDPLAEVLEAGLRYHAYIEDKDCSIVKSLSQIDLQFIRNLLGETLDRKSLSSADFDESALDASLMDTAGAFGRYQLLISKAVLMFLYEEHAASYEYLERAAAWLDACPRGMQYPDYFFYSSLILAEHLSSVSGRSPEIEERIDASLHNMEVWTGLCADNFKHRHLLMLAEQARATGHPEEAAPLYDRAIEAAHANRFLNHEAIANELAGRFYIGLGRERAARGYLEEALLLFERWGASAKVEQMLERYPQLGGRASGAVSRLSPTTTVPSIASDAVIDLETVVKAGNALTGEIVLERLLETLIGLVIENAGAERGSLLLETEGELWLEAEATTDHVLVLQHAAMESCSDLPRSVVRFVGRSGETVLLANASVEGQFTEDAYVRRASVKSLLTLPLIHQGRLIGVLTVENNLTPGAFTSERVELLRILCSQAATALENARLYATLEHKVEERTRSLQGKNEELALTLSQLEETQNQLIQSEKMAALGQLVAGIGHELNTPIGAIRAAGENIGHSLEYTLEQIPTLLRAMPEDQSQRFSRLVRKSLGRHEFMTARELRKQRRRLEMKLEDFGIEDPEGVADTLIDAGILGDIQQELPLFIGDNVDDVLQATYNLARLIKNCETIQNAVNRASKVVFALKTFSHRSSVGEKTQADIIAGIENVLTIYENYLKQGIEVIRRYHANPSIACFPDALQQVWTNLVHNALQAMSYNGRLEIDVAVENRQVTVQIIDDGPGVPEEVRPRIWDAFFTTKPAGEGSGLGLHICREIVARHDGELDFESQPGRTAFLVRLPAAMEETP